MLEVPAALTNAWRALAPAARDRIEAFLARGAPAGERAAVAGGDAMPETFVDDLAGGGARLRAAFPRLARRVIAIEPGARLAVRVACDGVHDGDFYGTLAASKRRVRFVVHHELALDGGAHRVSIDLRAIVRQLSDRSAAIAIA